MVRRLKVYFIHSSKLDYNNLIYKQVLSSSVCIMHDLILPYSDTYKNKYAKDLIKSADIIIIETSKSSFGFKLELKWALKSKKPIKFVSLTNKPANNIKKYIKDLELSNNDKSYIQIIENFINHYANMTKEEQNDNTIVLGEI